MITNNGKEIISKYLLGQTQAYATHISIGCGANPVSTVKTYEYTISSRSVNTTTDLATITTSTAHDFQVGDSVLIETTDFEIISKSLSSNVVTLTTKTNHPFTSGQTVVVDINDPIFDGTYTTTSGTTGTQIKYAKTHADILPAVLTSGFVSYSKEYDGVHTIVAIPSETTFKYALESGQTVTSTNIGSVSLYLLNKDVMDFEVARVPITSRGFVDENNITKVALTANLPSDNYYEISEVAVWSSGNNGLAGSYDSRNLFTFTETWQTHTGSDIKDVVSYQNASISSLTGDITVNEKIFSASSNNSAFKTGNRVSRKEGPRFLNSAILMRGDSSLLVQPPETSSTIPWTVGYVSVTNKAASGTNATLTTSSNHFLRVGDAITVSIGDPVFDGTYTINARTNTTISYAKTSSVISSTAATGTIVYNANTHIHKNGIIFDISENSPQDILKLAFSVIDISSAGNVTPNSVRIMVDFLTGDESIQTNYARAEFEISGGELDITRYNVISIPLSQLQTSSTFTSQQINLARVFVSVIAPSGSEEILSSDHYVVLDGIRIENIATVNPLYKMVGYSTIKTPNSTPITKVANSDNYVEFRFNLGVS